MHLLDAPLSVGGRSSGIVREAEIPGFVSEFDEREAAAGAAIPWSAWDDLPRDERVLAVAHARMRRLIEIHRDDAAYREQQRKQAMNHG